MNKELVSILGNGFCKKKSTSYKFDGTRGRVIVFQLNSSWIVSISFYKFCAFMEDWLDGTSIICMNFNWEYVDEIPA